MVDKKVRFGILGCADIAKRRFIPALIKSKLAQLAGIASRSKKKAENLASQYGIKSYTYDALLKSNDIDAIYIPLPNHLHLEWSIKALEEGKHVLCEKPIVLDVKSAYILTDFAKKNNRCLMEGYMFLYHPQHLKIKEVIKKRAIGKPRIFRSSFGFAWKKFNNFRMKKEMGGGVLFDNGGYPLAAIRFLFGAEPQETSGYAYCNQDGLDLSFSVTTLLNNGMIAQIHGSFIQAYECFYEIIGTEGIITLNRSYTTPSDLNNVIYVKRGYDTEEIQIPAEDHFANMIDYFCSNLNSIDIRQKLREDIILQAKALECIKRGLKRYA
jgi:predicted dehydrogenase